MSAEVGQRRQQEEEEEEEKNSSIDVTQSVEEDVPLDHPLLYADALVGDVRPYFKGNVVILLIFATQLSFELKGLMMYLILGVLTVELFFSSVCLFIYTVKIAKFNVMKPCPDIQEEERRHRYPNRTNILSETGFRDGSNLENLVEKQADLIDYLKMHNVQLSRRLLALISQQVRD
ncbi:transmembrane protein 192 isoform X3 [Amblyraja radiata]|uniref:transmembrane protein 192 isoform X3 n=1 Tax=Amblyraja radiata TaxID=386614 RepID=UPI0014029E7E|nr:transmembrane protein 192 isoform X3 [Amblyraja radiata]